jgi:hypothetical protein
MQKRFIALLLGVFMLTFASSAIAAEKVVNVYSARHYESDKALYALFEEQTGIKVNVISGKAVFATSDETQAKALEVMPALKNHYSIGDGLFEIYYLDEAKAVCSNMKGESEDADSLLTHLGGRFNYTINNEYVAPTPGFIGSMSLTARAAAR